MATKCVGVLPSRVISTDEGDVTIPEQACEREAVVLAVDIGETRCSEGEVHRKTRSTTPYCQFCAVPGNYYHEDGTITQHPPVSLV